MLKVLTTTESNLRTENSAERTGVQTISSSPFPSIGSSWSRVDEPSTFITEENVNNVFHKVYENQNWLYFCLHYSGLKTLGMRRLSIQALLLKWLFRSNIQLHSIRQTEKRDLFLLSPLLLLNLFFKYAFKIIFTYRSELNFSLATAPLLS